MFLVYDLNPTPVVMAKHGCSCVHFSGISTCGRTSRGTVSHPRRPPLPTLYKISLLVYVIVTNKRLQPLTTTWYNSLVLCFADGAAELLHAVGVALQSFTNLNVTEPISLYHTLSALCPCFCLQYSSILKINILHYSTTHIFRQL